MCKTFTDIKPWSSLKDNKNCISVTKHIFYLILTEVTEVLLKWPC